MNPKDIETLRKSLSNDNLAYRYQQFISFTYKAMQTGGLDKTEYNIFQKTTIYKDLQGLAHGLLSGVFTFEEYFDKITMIVGWDLMIRGIIDGKVSTVDNG